MHEKRSDYAHLTFVVITEQPLARGEQVFLAGSLPEAGEWAPDGIPMSRVEDLKWSCSFELPKNSRLDYKVTRGTWDTEEWHDEDGPPPNRHLTVRQDEVVTLLIKKWADTR